jgi:hypothetical protein
MIDVCSVNQLVRSALSQLTANNEVPKMKTLILFLALVSFSMGALANDHKNDHQHDKSNQHRLDGRNAFLHFDTDGDGAVSIKEHEAAIMKMANKRRQRFAEMDSNGDGSVSMEEARSVAQEKRNKWQQKMEEKHNKRFDMLDKNGDGMISREEAKALRELRPKR